jgi:hypothetical protein
MTADGLDLQANPPEVHMKFYYDSKILEDDRHGDKIETGAAGYVNLTENISLSLDLSYNAPQNSVFELLEARDGSGSMIRLLRDIRKREPTPCTVTHQTGDGEIVSVISRDVPLSLKMDNARLSGEARNDGPLGQFVEAVQSASSSVSGEDERGRECDARLLVNTDQLIRAIYLRAER